MKLIITESQLNRIIEGGVRLSDEQAKEVGSNVGADVKITGDIGIDKSSIPLDKISQPVNVGSILATNGDKLDLSAEEINLSYPGKKKYVRKITATNGAEKAIISFWKNGNKLIILHVESSKKGAGYGTDLINKIIKEAKEAGVEEIVADNVESLSSQKYWEKQGFIQDPNSRSNRILPIAPAKEIVKTQDMNLQESITRIKKMMGLNEGLHDTSWEDDKGNKVTLMDLLIATDHLPVKHISVERLKDKLLTWDGDNSEIQKIDMADLQYPILIFVNDEGNILSIIDGHHRAHKAIRLGLETIKCKLIPINSLPDNIRIIFDDINQ